MMKINEDFDIYFFFIFLQATCVVFVNTMNFVTVCGNLKGCSSKNQQIPTRYLRLVEIIFVGTHMPDMTIASKSLGWG